MNRSVLIVAGLLVGVVALVYWQFADRSFPAPSGSVATSDVADTIVTPPTSSPNVPSGGKTSRSSFALDDNRPFVEQRPDLERQARAGDGHAAWRLGMVLVNCNGYVPISDSKLESVVVDGFASGAFNADVKPDAFMQKLKIGLAQKQRDCRNVSGVNEDDANNKAFVWMELGASLGDADAQAMYAALAFESFDTRNALADAERIRERKRLAMDYLERSLAQGDGLALQRLSKAHSDGLLFHADAEVAYSYLYAFSLTPRANDFVPGLLEFALDSGAQALDTAALARAQEEGRRLASCCMEGSGEQP